MRRYYPPARIPRGTHTLQFGLLDAEEQRQKVKSLLTAGIRERAVAHLTGLSIEQIRRMSAT